MKTMNEVIAKIKVNGSNLQYIAETGHINGSLLMSIQDALREYAESAIDQCAQSSAMVVSARRIGATANMEAILKVKTLLK